ncbi:MAG: HEPN domain-containing protein [Methanophagales archaeon ANME-1-THS]|nr:MAG: HEPN domain-containing protein [Methanophagales archaeon ANME-1-THS]
MRTDELARDYLARAELILGEARNAASNEVYSLAIRRAQETVELSLKAALRFLAIEYPRDHDIGDVLLRVKETRPIPNWFRDKIDLMARVSSDLARKRGPAFYGDECAGMPASQLFTREESLRALNDAEEIFKLCKRLIL